MCIASDLMSQIQCPVTLSLSNGTILSPATLVDYAAHTHSLEIVIKNLLDDERQLFSFEPNWDLFGGNLPMLGTSSASRMCHFTGNSESGLNALSTCSKEAITGLIHINDYHYVFESKDDGFIMRPQSVNSCSWERSLRMKRSALMSVPEYYEGFIDHKRTRHVELIFVGDKSLYKKYGRNETKVHDRLHSIANVVNAVYQPLNVRITLVYAVIWKDEDPIEVSPKSDTTLVQFLKFRRGLMDIHNHDNAQLITDVEFADLVIGKAYKGTMCSFEYSGGIIYDHSTSAAAVASTSAHEMGHSFGMEHDPKYCNCPEALCIMAASNGGYTNLTYFSDCSLNYLKHSFERKMDYCLFNVPKKVFGGSKCGNGIVEEGEECDCGNKNVCPNKCCVASKCRLAKDAYCASGDCCDLDTCKPKPKAQVCRETISVCDLPEFCDGETGDCPADFFVQNGLKCPSKIDTSYCYEGECGDRDEQCQMIFGDKASKNDNCYQMNTMGNMFGNCGTTKETPNFPCTAANVQCGKVYCSAPNKTSVFGDPSTVTSLYYDFTLRDGSKTVCRTIHTSSRGGKLNRDPSFARDGANCGNSKMCLNNRCEHVSAVMEISPKCDPSNCNLKGICNNVGNCHCEYGYGGVSCDIPGYGGSVNSGPATDKAFNALIYVAILTAVLCVLFGIASYFYKKKTNKFLPATMWRSFRSCAGVYGRSVPIRKAPPPPKPTDDLNAWGSAPTDLRVGSQAILPPLVSHFITNPAADVQFHSLTPADDFINSPSPPAVSFNRYDHRYNPVPDYNSEFKALNQATDSSSSDENSSSIPAPPPVPPHRAAIIRPSTQPPPPLKPKPKLPVKPPVSTKPVTGPNVNTNVNVKDLAAKFNVKNSNVDLL